jgi:hypothetical protein
MILTADYFTIPGDLVAAGLQLASHTAGRHLNFAFHTQVGRVAQTVVTGHTNMSLWH